MAAAAPLMAQPPIVHGVDAMWTPLTVPWLLYSSSTPRIWAPPGVSFVASYCGRGAYCVGLLSRSGPSMPTFQRVLDAGVLAASSTLGLTLAPLLNPLTLSNQSTPH